MTLKPLVWKTFKDKHIAYIGDVEFGLYMEYWGNYVIITNPMFNAILNGIRGVNKLSSVYKNKDDAKKRIDKLHKKIIELFMEKE